ncbi:hypothetical protein EVAR_37342_1 [Eumeta japonica]|uniref:Uncharacterized protein n=1 Tax=Eumeta variegata TaxID=151549 RepID=A0A4C1X1S0_EUMVA|nr:hypothetical protein EVAR_37342_1 [Eumeta japonica]
MSAPTTIFAWRTQIYSLRVRRVHTPQTRVAPASQTVAPHEARRRRRRRRPQGIRRNLSVRTHGVRACLATLLSRAGTNASTVIDSPRTMRRSSDDLL